MKEKSKKFILWFKETSKRNVALVGGKNASLGEMLSQLSKKGVNIPDGFATTSFAYWYFLKENNILLKLKNLFKKLDTKNIKSLQETGKQARNLILKSEFPEDLKKEIIKEYIYDENGRLIRVVTTIITYDENGNIKSVKRYLEIRSPDGWIKTKSQDIFEELPILPNLPI